MASGKRIVLQEGFRGGLNRLRDPRDLAASEAYLLENAIYATEGTVKCRTAADLKATLAASADNENIRNMFRAVFSSTSAALVVVSGKKIYTMNETTFGLTDVTPAAGGLSLSSGRTIRGTFANYNGVCYFANGTDKIVALASAAGPATYLAATPTGTSRPRYITIHRESLVGINDPAGIVVWSTAGDPTIFPVNNFHNLRKFSIGPPTGMVSIGDRCIVFFPDELWWWDTPEFFANLTMAIPGTWNRGCRFPFTVQKTPFGWGYGGDEHAYVTDGGASQPMTQAIIPWWKADVLAQSQVESKSACCLGGRYTLFYDKAAAWTDDNAVVMDLHGIGSGGWVGPWKGTDIGGNACFAYVEAGVEKLYIANGNSIYLWPGTVGAASFKIVTRGLSVPDLRRVRVWRVAYEAASVTLGALEPSRGSPDASLVVSVIANDGTATPSVAGYTHEPDAGYRWRKFYAEIGPNLGGSSAVEHRSRGAMVQLVLENAAGKTDIVEVRRLGLDATLHGE